MVVEVGRCTCRPLGFDTLEEPAEYFRLVGGCDPAADGPALYLLPQALTAAMGRECVYLPTYEYLR